MSGGPIILESEGFRRQLQQLAALLELEDRYFDRARAALQWVLREPERCQAIPGHPQYRIAKTRRYTIAGVSIPALRVLFRLHQNGTVELLSVAMTDFYL